MPVYDLFFGNILDMIIFEKVIKIEKFFKIYLK